jgi:F-actin-capping protein subunit alpha
LVTKYGEVNAGEYLDPAAGVVFGFDHIRQAPTGSTRAEGGVMDKSIEGHRKAFEGAAAQYVAEHYMNGASAVYGAKEGGQSNLTICISSAKFNPNNFWNGRWRSVWTCVVSGNKANLSGNLKINVHYYEDGNVQLNTEATKTVAVTGNDPNSLAAAALQAIKKIESEFHAALEHSYSTMSETTFKALRRNLPITRCRIDWSKIRSYSLNVNAKNAM